VAVHGMDGNREESWTTDNGTCWLRDLLPKYVPRARILSYGYDAYTRDRDTLSAMFLNDVAQGLINELVRFRTSQDITERPIVFIAHSLGGIVLKAALIHASHQSRNNLFPHKQIHIATFGILFLGTPHQGSDHVRRAVQTLRIVSLAKVKKTNIKLMRHLRPNSEMLQMMQSQFNPIARDFVIKSAYEHYPTPLIWGMRSLIVPRDSAVMQGAVDAEEIGISADHTNIAKFSSENNDDFQVICNILQKMVTNAPEAIRTRFQHQNNY